MTSLSAEVPTLPLTGVRVVDFTHHAAGPMCTMLLADYGAEVIKVEPPEGEAFRTSGTVRIKGEHVGFLALNRNKKSVVLDLKTTEGREAVLALIATSHVAVENFRPGTMARLGLEYEQLLKANPRIIFCSLSAFGASGPYRDKQGLDLVLQAMSGLMSLTGEPGGRALPAGAPISDMSAGVFGALGVVLALLEQRKSGKPQRVDISMLDCMIALLCVRVQQMYADGKDLPRLGAGHPQACPWDIFHAADGAFVIAATRDEYWAGICNCLGVPELKNDPRFATIGARVENCKVVNDLLSAIFASGPREHWLQLLDEANVPNGPVNNLSDMVKNAQVIHNGTITTVPHPKGGEVPAVAAPIRINDARLKYGGAPAIGADTAQILLDLKLNRNGF